VIDQMGLARSPTRFVRRLAMPIYCPAPDGFHGAEEDARPGGVRGHNHASPTGATSGWPTVSSALGANDTPGAPGLQIASHLAAAARSRRRWERRGSGGATRGCYREEEVHRASEGPCGGFFFCFFLEDAHGGGADAPGGWYRRSASCSTDSGRQSREDAVSLFGSPMKASAPSSNPSTIVRAEDQAHFSDPFHDAIEHAGPSVERPTPAAQRGRSAGVGGDTCCRVRSPRNWRRAPDGRHRMPWR